MSPNRLKAYFSLILVAAIWGAAGPVIKFTLEGIDPLPFLSYRFAILYGLLAVPISLGILFIGLDKTTVLDLTLIGVAGPLIVTAGGALFFHDHITHKERIGISIV